MLQLRVVTWVKLPTDVLVVGVDRAAVVVVVVVAIEAVIGIVEAVIGIVVETEAMTETEDVADLGPDQDESVRSERSSDMSNWKPCASLVTSHYLRSHAALFLDRMFRLMIMIPL